MDDAIFFSSAAEFGEWLASNGAQQTELWVGYWKKATGKPSLSWEQSVDEALCHGWIDGVRYTIDEERYRIRFTPRRGSRWSARNLRRVAELQKQGRMRPAGIEAFEARSSDEAGYSQRERTVTTLPPDFQRQLEANAAAWAFFESQPPGYRKNAVHWVTDAKRESTRERRLQTLIEDSANGLRIGPLRR